MTALPTKTTILPDDPRWPDRLGESLGADAVHVLGNATVLSGPCVAVFGSANWSADNTVTATVVGRAVAESGGILLWPETRGTEVVAVEAALDAGGTVVVCSGVAADRVVQKEDSAICERALSSGGAVVSLQPWGTEYVRGPSKGARRLAAGLSTVAVQVGSDLVRGDTRGASEAMAMGRDVLAVPSLGSDLDSPDFDSLVASGALVTPDDRALSDTLRRVLGTSDGLPAALRAVDAMEALSAELPEGTSLDGFDWDALRAEVRARTS